jgi:5'-nucleotidase
MNLQKKRKTIAIDMDGVLADVEIQFINWYEKEYGIRVSQESMLGKTESDSFPDKTAIRRFVLTPGFFSSLPLMPGAVEAVKELMENYEVYIVSAAMEFPQSLIEKYNWLQEHFPFIGWRNIILCGDKSVINTDYMIDDHCKNLDTCTGKGILFSAAHNANITHHIRANNWTEVLALFEKEFEPTVIS